MGFFSGCMDARSMTSIKEVKCPKCSADIEVFVRDGKTVGDSVCDNCGYMIKENLELYCVIEQLQRMQFLWSI